MIPTPSPDPDDFVAEIDNPWLPLAPGSTWTRESTGSRISSSRVQVLEETRDVAGVETTRVRTTLLGQDGDTVGARVDLYAQDRGGNVWTFGQEGVWQAGSLGAEAGLAMPATPRVGDGFLRARVPGADLARTQVQDAPESVSVPAGEFTDLVQTQESDPEGAGEWQVVYARGVGEVLRAELDGGGRQGAGRPPPVRFSRRDGSACGRRRRPACPSRVGAAAPAAPLGRRSAGPGRRLRLTRLGRRGGRLARVAGCAPLGCRSAPLGLLARLRGVGLTGRHLAGARLTRHARPRRPRARLAIAGYAGCCGRGARLRPEPGTGVAPWPNSSG